MTSPNQGRPAAREDIDSSSESGESSDNGDRQPLPHVEVFHYSNMRWLGFDELDQEVDQIDALVNKECRIYQAS